MLPFSADDVVTNFSAYSPTDEELDILKFGLSHFIYPPKVNKSDVYVAFEQIHYLASKKIKNKISTDFLTKTSAKRFETRINPRENSPLDFRTGYFYNFSLLIRSPSIFG